MKYHIPHALDPVIRYEFIINLLARSFRGTLITNKVINIMNNRKASGIEMYLPIRKNVDRNRK